MRKSCYLVLVMVSVLLASCGSSEKKSDIKSHDDIRYSKFSFLAPTPAQYKEEVSYQSAGQEKKMTVFLLPNKDQRFITLHILVKAGRYLDIPDNKPGLSSITWALLSSFTNEQEKKWYSLAAHLTTSLSNDRAFITLEVSPDNFNKALMLLRDSLTGEVPVDSGELLKIKKSVLASLKLRNSTVSSIANRVENRVAYGRYFFVNQLPTKSSVDSISVSDVREFVNSVVRPDNFIVAVSGDFDKVSMKKELEYFIKKWPRSEKNTSTPIPSHIAFKSQGVFVYDDPGQKQAAIRVIFPGIMKSNKDFFALTLVNQELGLGMNSRLFSTIRTRSGLTYDIRSQLYAFPYYSGPIVISCQVKVGNVIKTIGLIKQELQILVDNGLVNSELGSVKELLNGQFPRRFTINKDISLMLLNAAFNRDFLRDDHYFRNWQEKIKSVSLDDVDRVIKQYLNPKDMRVVIVGDVKQMGDLTSLKSIGSVDYLSRVDPETLKPVMSL